jgi:ankyrin repeat protein
MARRITPQTNLDNLKKEAKRWLKALRSKDSGARERLLSAFPKAPADPVLRDVQYALAREYEFENWKSLKDALEDQAPAGSGSGQTQPPELVLRFLDFACPDHHVRGRPAHRIARHAALRILNRHPEIARHNLDTSVVCGELDEVQRILREQPQLALVDSAAPSPDRSGPGSTRDIDSDMGPKGWTPLLYLCFTRLDLPKATENALEIARLLLDHGADPNAYFMAGSSRYTPLTGVIGEGEENRPPHPCRDQLTHLLLERGAEPYDTQVIYNIHFHGKILWYVKLMYEFSVRAGCAADWNDPEWHMLDMGGYGTGARWHLQTAVEHNDLELAEWCLQHGANPNSPPTRNPTLPQKTLYEQAVRLGNIEMSELFARYGADRRTVRLRGIDAFISACFRLDRAKAEAQIAKHPEYKTSPTAMHRAAARDCADVVELLLALGVSPDIEDPHAGNQRPLHAAAYNGAEFVTRLLIQRGAQIDPLDSTHQATPLFFAIWAQQNRTTTWLSRYSRDVHALTFLGNLERVREVLRAEPQLALTPGETTPLFWLPEDERRAIELVDLLLSCGVDAKFRRKPDGKTAAQIARRRGLDRAADRLEAAERASTRRDAAPPDTPAATKYERLAQDMVTAYATGDADAMQRINAHYGRNASVEDLRAIVWRLIYKVRQAGGSSEAFGLAEAQELIARTSGFPSWTALIEWLAKGAPPRPAYVVKREGPTIEPRRILTNKDWDEVVAAMKDRRIPRLNSAIMTDEALKRVSELDFVTGLSLGGSREMSDDGMQYLARMPQLEYLNLSEYPGGKLTDKGLEVLRHLPNLRTLEMTWQKGITDKGAANLRFCEKLERVDLMGSPTGDGAIKALCQKNQLRDFSTGRLVTDAGLALLRGFPRFAATGSEDPPTRLLLDGPFTDRGLANLRELKGVVELDLFWHVTSITAEGFRYLVDMPGLTTLGCDGRLSNDGAMRYIASMPRLRKLRAQESVATEDGFIALSQSKTLETLWGRECQNFASRAFAALSEMPALRSLGIGCQKVDDSALSLLPQFRALRELTPVGFTDDGFRHIGSCTQLERLSCMYCRETTDAATEHIADLNLESYYAGLTQITDRSLEILGLMASLETVELFETKSVTNTGLAHLAKLPGLKRVELFGLPHVTPAGTKVFADGVEVNYEP